MKPETCKVGMVVRNTDFPPRYGVVQELGFVQDSDCGLVPSALVKWYLPGDPAVWVNVSLLESNEKPWLMAPGNIEPVRLLDPTGEHDGEALN